MGEVAKQASTKVLVHVINKITSELKRLRHNKHIYDFNKDYDIYKFYFDEEGTLRLSKCTIIYEENYVVKLELGYGEVILNGIRYPLSAYGAVVGNLLDRCTEEVYNLYKGLIILNTEVEREQ